MILEIGSKGFVGPSIFWPLKMGLKRRKVENHWFKRFVFLRNSKSSLILTRKKFIKKNRPKTTQ